MQTGRMDKIARDKRKRKVFVFIRKEFKNVFNKK